MCHKNLQQKPGKADYTDEDISVSSNTRVLSELSLTPFTDYRTKFSQVSDRISANLEVHKRIGK